jgi:CheY-like chemotaxis protein
MFYFNCILLVDDDPIINELHKEILKQHYFADQIVDVLSAEEAFEFINKFHEEKSSFPELILVDINMPGMDGFQFVQQLNKLPFAEKDTFKISALTSSADPRDIRMMNELGVKSYVVKPLDFRKVKEVVYSGSTL